MFNCYLEKVKKKHKCHKCEVHMIRECDRVHFNGINYCISCGYEMIKESINEYENFLSELKGKFSKKIVIARLQK